MVACINASGIGLRVFECFGKEVASAVSALLSTDFMPGICALLSDLTSHASVSDPAISFYFRWICFQQHHIRYIIAEIFVNLHVSTSCPWICRSTYNFSMRFASQLDPEVFHAFCGSSPLSSEAQPDICAFFARSRLLAALLDTDKSISDSSAFASRRPRLMTCCRVRCSPDITASLVRAGIKLSSRDLVFSSLLSLASTVLLWTVICSSASAAKIPSVNVPSEEFRRYDCDI